MKTYEQWSSRAKQLGWSPSQYSQAAYQGYVNNMQQQSQPAPGGGNPDGSPAPMSYSPPPLQPQPQPQNEDLQQQIKHLSDRLEQQTSAYEAELASAKAKIPGDASKALNSTILTSAVGLSGDEKKKKLSLLGVRNGY